MLIVGLRVTTALSGILQLWKRHDIIVSEILGDCIILKFLDLWRRAFIV